MPTSDVDRAEPELAQDLDPRDGVDVRVQVLHPDPGVGQVVGQVLGHLLGQRRHQDAPAGRHRARDAGQQVVDLALGGHDRHLGVDQPGGPDHLLDDLGRVLELERARSGRHEHGLGHALDELVETQRAVVLGRGQAEAVLDERRPCASGRRRTARAAGGRATWLSSMTHEVVLGEEVEQRVGRLPRCPPVEMPAVVLHPRADARLGQHLEVVLGARPAGAAPRAACPPARTPPAARAAPTSMLPTARCDDLVAGDVVRGGDRPPRPPSPRPSPRSARRRARCARRCRRTSRPGAPAPRRRGGSPPCRPGPGRCRAPGSRRCGRTGGRPGGAARPADRAARPTASPRIRSRYSSGEPRP